MPRPRKSQIAVEATTTASVDLFDGRFCIPALFLFFTATVPARVGNHYPVYEGKSKQRMIDLAQKVFYTKAQRFSTPIWLVRQPSIVIAPLVEIAERVVRGNYNMNVRMLKVEEQRKAVCGKTACPVR